MKTVRRDVAHCWAHQTQSEARTPGSGNLFFRDDTIYSYGAHFPIARIVKMRNGESAVLFTTRDYSNTTAKHKSEVLGACRHMPVFRVRDVLATPGKTHIADFTKRVKNAITDADAYAARKNNRGIQHAVSYLQRIVADANQFCSAFGFKTRFALPDNFADLERLANEEERKESVRSDARRAANDARWAESERIRRLSQRERVAEFMGVPVDDVTDDDLMTDHMKVVDGEVRTTKHAVVTVEQVQRVAKLVLGTIRSGKTYHRNGTTMRVGAYPLDSIDENGTVKVGCHTFDRREIERMAKILQVD